MGASVAEQAIPVPEPDLTPDELVARAVALQPAIREQQEETEQRGYPSQELQDEFVRAGFFRCLQPRRYGGYEFEVGTYYRLAIELSRGDPSTAWNMILGGNHAIMLGSYFEEGAQTAGFGADGHFIAPSVAAPAGVASPHPDGWHVEGRWGYASGAPYSTHFTPTVLVKDDEAPDGMRPGIALIPRSQFTVLDDWGAILGMRGSGSNTIVVENAVVPHDHVVKIDMLDVDVSDGTPGSRLHGNAMYAGRCLSYFHAGLVGLMVGLGRAALDEYEEILRTRNTIFPPIVPRYLQHDFQRSLGLATGMIEAAELLVVHAGELYMDYCRRGFAGGEPFTYEEDLKLFVSLEHGGRLAWEAVELLFRTAGSDAAKDGRRLQRYYRDISIYRGHLSAQYETIAERLGKVVLGVPVDSNANGDANA
jgi:3-hydroxy-9,10-secoandrosta-1,3,5(10)-triene-9,17-dione monooxygenase